eukprot:4555378-Prymnesium_polylepis.1
MDWHFKRNMRGKAKGSAPPSRRWMLSVDAWVKLTPGREADVEQATVSVFDSLEQTDDGADAAQDADLPVSCRAAACVLGSTRGSARQSPEFAAGYMDMGWVASFTAVGDSRTGNQRCRRRAQVMRAPPDVSKLICFQCGEEVPIFWDSATAEWMLRDAVHAKDGSGRICHSGCAGP